MPEGSTVVVDGKPSKLYYFTGRVLSSQKQKETQVHSQSYGTQHNPQVSVSSTTVDHHEFFLADSAGKERAFKMVDFDFPCREGNTLSVVWVIPEAKTDGPYIEVHNHSTGERHLIEPKRIATWFRKPMWMIWAIAIGGAIVIGLMNGFFGLIAFVVPFVYFTWRARNAAKELLASNELRELDSQLTQVKAITV